jgi:hypothetical protein
MLTAGGSIMLKKEPTKKTLNKKPVKTALKKESAKTLTKNSEVKINQFEKQFMV